MGPDLRRCEWLIGTYKPYPIIFTFGQVCPYSHYNLVVEQPTWKLTIKPTTHPKPTLVNTSQSPTLYYFEPLPMV